MQNQFNSEMQSQYEKFIQFQQFMEMQKKTEGVVVADEAKDGGEVKPLGEVQGEKGSREAKCRSSRKSRVARKEDKENIQPEPVNLAGAQQVPDQLHKTSKTEFSKPHHVAVMPAGESSDEEQNKVEQNNSGDSYDFIQQQLEQELRLQKK